MLFKNISFLLLFLMISSCSSMNKIVVSAGSGLMLNASSDMETESNFELLKSSIAPNLKMLEGLLSQSPNNQNLLLTLTKGYTALAFLVNETEMYEEEWSGKKTEENKRQALKNYTRALSYGLRYLEENKIFKMIIILS